MNGTVWAVLVVGVLGWMLLVRMWVRRLRWYVRSLVHVGYVLATLMGASGFLDVPSASDNPGFYLLYRGRRYQKQHGRWVDVTPVRLRER